MSRFARPPSAEESKANHLPSGTDGTWSDALVGPHFGIVEAVERVPCEPDDLPLAVYAGRLCRTSAFQAVDAPRTASGAAIDPPDALAACLGEAAERYAAALVAPGSIIHACADELSGDVLTPDRFALFSARQYVFRGRRFPFRRWRPGDTLSWRRVRCLLTDHSLWAPAVFVHQPFLPEPGEPTIAPTLSTGLATAADSLTATAGGLCEVIERDAVALAWLGRTRPPRIVFDHHGCEAGLRSLAEQLDARGFRWAVFDLTTDLRVPVAAALIEGNSSVGNVVSFGAACHPCSARAVGKALIEAAHCRMYVKSLVREDPQWRAGRRLERMTGFAEHARFHTSHPDRRSALERWWTPPQTTRWDCSRQAEEIGDAGLAALRERLAEAGHSAYSVDLTPPDLASLGLHVVRTLVPGLQPLHGNHAWPHLGGARLRRLRSVFGPHVRQPWRWNCDPHPCP